MRLLWGAIVLFTVATRIFGAEMGSEQPAVRVYNLPGTSECAESAESECDMIVRMCASDETECEIQCRSTKPPELSEACLNTHPCATDVETYCSDIPPGSVMSCLKDHRTALNSKCQAVSMRHGAHQSCMEA
jgi:hypothetical protein